MLETTTWDSTRRRVRRAQSWLLCHLGRHLYVRRRNPEVSGADAMYEICRRCGNEKGRYTPGHWWRFT